MNKRHYEHTLPNIRGSLSNTYVPDGVQINTLIVETNIPVHKMSALLFELEMKGVIRTLAGGVYRLII